MCKYIFVVVKEGKQTSAQFTDYTMPVRQCRAFYQVNNLKSGSLPIKYDLDSQLPEETNMKPFDTFLGIRAQSYKTNQYRTFQTSSLPCNLSTTELGEISRSQVLVSQNKNNHGSLTCQSFGANFRHTSGPTKVELCTIPPARASSPPIRRRSLGISVAVQHQVRL